MAEGDICELVVKGRYLSAELLAVLGFRQRASGGGGTFAQLCTDFKIAAQSNYVNGKSTGFTITEYNVIDVVPGTAATYQETPSPTPTGSDGGTPGPPATCAVVTWNTALKGRSYRGRTYMGGYAQTSFPSGLVIASVQTTITTWANYMITRYGPSGTSAVWEFGIISRVSGGVGRPTPIFTPVTGWASDWIARQQRRREVGVGN